MLVPSPSDMSASSNCKRCRAAHGKRGAVCPHCRHSAALMAYRDALVTYRLKRTRELLFEAPADVAGGAGAGASSSAAAADNYGGNANNGGDDDEDDDDDDLAMINGTFATESLVVKLLLHFARACRHLDGRLHATATLAVSDMSKRVPALIRALTQEAMAFTRLWRHEAELLSATDELRMCISRVRLAAPGEKVQDEDRHFILKSYEMDSRQRDLHLRQTAFEADWRKWVALRVRRCGPPRDDGVCGCVLLLTSGPSDTCCICVRCEKKVAAAASASETDSRPPTRA